MARHVRGALRLADFGLQALLRGDEFVMTSWARAIASTSSSSLTSDISPSTIMIASAVPATMISILLSSSSS